MRKTNSFFILFLVSILFFCSCSEIVEEKDLAEKTVNLVAPVNNAQFFSSGVTFSWEALKGATQYQIQIAKPNFSNPLQIVIDSNINTNSFTQQLPIGDYEWRVKALNNSSSTNYTTRFIAVISNADFQSNTVILSSPANNLITNTAAQFLSWQSILGATNYQIQVYNASNTLVLDQSTTTNSYNYTFPVGDFQWRVRASNGTQQTLYSSRSILVDVTAPNTPILNSPANSSTTTASSITFEWSRVPIVGSAEKDAISIYSNSALTTLVSTTETTSPYTTTLAAGTYYWRVKSTDTAGNIGSNSLVFSFTIN